MRILPLLLPAALLACDSTPPAAEALRPVAGGRDPVHDDFTADSPAWTFRGGRWERRDGVLVQSAPADPWAVALFGGATYSDVDLSVRVKPVSGAVDRSGGLVFRARDAGSYYLVRTNALEDNVRLYTMIDGRRTQIASTKAEPPKSGAWHVLRVVAKGRRIQVHVDGRLLLDHEDGTFHEGRVGLWTKADSVTEFDDFKASVPGP